MDGVRKFYMHAKVIKFRRAPTKKNRSDFDVPDSCVRETKNELQGSEEKGHLATEAANISAILGKF